MKRIGGWNHAKTEMEPEYCLHIRAAVGEPAAHLPLRHDHGGRPHGLRKDHGSELVSGGARQGGNPENDPHQRILRQPRHLLEKRTGGVCPNVT